VWSRNYLVGSEINQITLQRRCNTQNGDTYSLLGNPQTHHLPPALRRAWDPLKALRHCLWMCSSPLQLPPKLVLTTSCMVRGYQGVWSDLRDSRLSLMYCEVEDLIIESPWCCVLPSYFQSSRQGTEPSTGSLNASFNEPLPVCNYPRMRPLNGTFGQTHV
jgi:hypothetical protein